MKCSVTLQDLATLPNPTYSTDRKEVSASLSQVFCLLSEMDSVDHSLSLTLKHRHLRLKEVAFTRVLGVGCAQAATEART